MMPNGLRPTSSLARLSIAGLACLMLVSGGAAQSPAEKTGRQENFGSSLERFRRDPRKQVGSGAQQTRAGGGTEQPEDVVRVDTLLTVLDVAVTDASGSRAITGLNRDDFVVVEDGVPQQIDTLTPGDDTRKLPRSIVLIVDWSGSLLPYLDESIKAAKTLVDKLAPTDEMAIVTDDVRLAIDFTRDKKRLKSTLDSFKKLARKGWTGKSLQFSALLATLRELVDVEKKRPIIIFQTDGDEAQRIKDPPLAGSTAPGVYYMSDVYTAVEKSQVKIYTVVPGRKLTDIPPSELLERGRQMVAGYENAYREYYKPYDRRSEKPRVPDQVVHLLAELRAHDQAAAARVAELTGGWASFLERPEQASEIYGRILSDINSRYVIGYYPTNKARDGRLRTVRVEVKGHPDYVVHGRRSYYVTSQ